MTYVDFTHGGTIPYVTISAPFNTSQKFDLSSFSSQFTHTPILLNLQLDFNGSLAANSDMESVDVNDANATDSAFSFSFFRFYSSVAGGAFEQEDTYLAQPFDFNGTTTFNVWLDIFLSSGITPTNYSVS